MSTHTGTQMQLELRPDGLYKVICKKCGFSAISDRETTEYFDTIWLARAFARKHVC